MKNLLKILIPVLGFSLANANAGYSQTQEDSAESGLYEDFKKFVKEKDNWHLTLRPTLDGEKIYYYKNHIFDAMVTSKQISLYFDNGEKTIDILDNGANGLNPKEKDICFKYQIDGKNITDSRELNDSNSTELSKEYEEILRQIMRNEKFGGY